MQVAKNVALASPPLRASLWPLQAGHCRCRRTKHNEVWGQAAACRTRAAIGWLLPATGPRQFQESSCQSSWFQRTCRKTCWPGKSLIHAASSAMSTARSAQFRMSRKLSGPSSTSSHWGTHPLQICPSVSSLRAPCYMCYMCYMGLTRQAAEPPLSPAPCYMYYMCYIILYAL